MNSSALGLIAGLLLAITATTGGFGGFLLGLVLGVVGYVAVGQLEGELDLSALTRGRQRG